MNPATAINVSTLAIIAVLFALHTRTFIKGGKDPKVLLTGIGGMIAGSSLAMSVGGALGLAATYIVGSTNTAAAVAPWATGTSDRTLASGSPQGLTMEGGIIVLVVSVIAWVSIREAGKKERLRLLGGLISGAALTYTAGFGGLVNSTLIPIYNGIGGQLVSFVENLA
ncbi:hypothetical protein ACH4RG_23250 [Streptomyces sp. NPDC021019]|uniref:hypothetical protein n=1 Tax=Streptomyces sp. NPDC021019 TaxID=3365108 RepID=UPI003794D1B6